MPADLPSGPVIVIVPYFRVIAFIVGGAATLAVLLVLGSLFGQLPHH